MFEKLQAIEERYLELEKQISDPEVIARQDEWRKLTKEHARLTEIVNTFRQYRQVTSDLEEAKELLQETEDEEMQSFLKEEIAANSEQREELKEKLRFL